MPFKLTFQPEAVAQLRLLERGDPKKLKKVRKSLGMIEINPKHPGLNSHKYHDLAGVNGEEIWESYVENNTPAAWRVFWHYGPSTAEITIIAITPHP